MIRKYALSIEYNGAAYHGWQRQQGVVSVQQKVEQALSKVADTEITIVCAGRTDAGVHATGQVVHFETDRLRPDKAWLFGTNHHLPDDISVLWVKSVPDEFHARFSATARRYRYLILNRLAPPALMRAGFDHCHRPLDAATMNLAARYFIGEQDFSSVRAAACQSSHGVRNIHFLDIHKQLDYVIIDIQANAFLLHMVRNIVGILKRVGVGEAEPLWVEQLLAARDRRLAPATASARGLYLTRVAYPSRFALPKNDVGPMFLGNQL